MTSNHTPGPWAVQKWGDGSSKPGFSNVTAPAHEVILAFDVPDDDARLIAAAPDMYEALTPLIVIALDNLDDMDAETRAECERDIAAARAALAKAEGKT